MKQFITLNILVFLFLFLEGCSVYAPRTNAPVEVPPPSVLSPKQLIMDMDILEISYYQTNALQEAPYKLQVGDVLKVELSGRTKLSTTQARVLPDGTISLNLIGNLYAAGLTLKEFTATLLRQYQHKGIKNPDIAIIMLETDKRLNQFMSSLLYKDSGSTLARRIYEHQPLELPFIGPTPVVNRDFADVRREIRDRYSAIFGEQLDVTVNLRERKRQEIYVMGEVILPGAVGLERGNNALVAIAAAGGLKATANRDNIFIIRFKEDGSYYHWFLNHDAAFSDPENSRNLYALRTDDIVYVPRSPITNVNEFIDQYIRKIIPLQGNISIIKPIK